MYIFQYSANPVIPVIIPVIIYLFKVNNKNSRERCDICSKLAIKTPERCHWRIIGVAVSLLLT